MLNKWRKKFIILVSVTLLFMMGTLVYAETVKNTVVIDPAHGGEDTGVIGVDKLAEKDLTLAIALALKKELAGDPRIEVVLTRESDKTLSLDERKKTILTAKPALVLSLHVNAGFGKTASGYELYYPGFKNVEAPAGSGKSQTAAGNTAYLNDTVKLARLVRQNLDSLFPRKGRGLRESETPLHEGLKVPTLIVEMGFVTNADEKKKLTKVKTQTDIARALARSIKTYF
ncbi:MAG: N-acetylmuramoyl-L-alanine amidase [Smithellaceae bacterium]